MKPESKSASTRPIDNNPMRMRAPTQLQTHEDAAGIIVRLAEFVAQFDQPLMSRTIDDAADRSNVMSLIEAWEALGGSKDERPTKAQVLDALHGLAKKQTES